MRVHGLGHEGCNDLDAVIDSLTSTLARGRATTVGLVLFTAGGLQAGGLRAQEPDAEPRRIPGVTVTVTREVGRSPFELPFAITVTEPDSARPGQRRLGLDETLLLVPGIAVANRQNPTQDPRVSIRGFGARSAFGVRGVRVLRDGIPLTLPDGQTPVDFLDLESIGSVEVIRGSASALYGNAAGGVVSFRSAAPPTDPFAVELRGSTGTHDSRRLTGAMGGTSEAGAYQLTASHTRLGGFRDYARQRVTHVFGRLQAEVGGMHLAVLGMGFDMPVAENPGALTADQMAANRRMADPLNVARRARKEARQWQAGMTAARPIGRNGDLELVIYGGERDLTNPLAFSINDIDRELYGVSTRATVPFEWLGRTHRISFGMDVQRQDDDRVEYNNCNVDGAPITLPTAACPTPGRERGARRRDQRELVTGLGPFARGELLLGSRVGLHLGLRADHVRFAVTDRLVTPTNPDDSGDRTLSAWSPMIGVIAAVTPTIRVYANVSTAFETPTATELNNSEGSAGGINRDLDPQYARTLEAGVKGGLGSRVLYDVALFTSRVRNELIPFEVLDGSGRRFFRNAGRTTRTGVEIGIASTMGAFHAGGTYTFAAYEFDEYTVDGTSFAGRTIPGVPTHQAQAGVTWRNRRAFVTTEIIAASRVYVNDANDATSAGYGVVNLRIGGMVDAGRPWLSPVLGIHNVLDTRYVSSVSVNATGGRYYEPAPGRVVYAGLTAALGR